MKNNKFKKEIKNEKIALLLGGNYLNEGILEKFNNNSYYTIVIDWNEDPYLKGNKHLQIDVKDKEKILDALNAFGVNEENFVLAYTSIDLAVDTVNKLNKYFQKNFTSDESLVNIATKKDMTKCWNKSKILNRMSYCIDTQNELNELIKTIDSKKILIKPSVASSSRGLTIVLKNDIKSIYNAFEYAKQFSYDDFVMLEEYIEGTEYTVELLGDNYGNVGVYGISKKYHTKNVKDNKIAIKLHFNANDVDTKKQNKIADFGVKCYKALGLSNSFGHLEVIEKENGEIVPVEIGGRSSGFIASHLIDITSERNYIEDYIDVINNKKLFNGLAPQSNQSSMYYFYDLDNNRKSQKICNIMNYLNNSIVSHYFKRDNLVKDKIFDPITNDIERYGYEVLSGKREILTIEEVSISENKFLNCFFGSKIFYDAHAHKIEEQNGGFIIALDGEPYFKGTIQNENIFSYEDKNNYLYAVEYVTKYFNKTVSEIVKYHPRREHYSVESVINDIESRKPKIAIIDTLNQPYWQPLDYWKIALKFPKIQFLFCHAGGYDIHEFIKIIDFQKNVWIDFSLTQEYFGWIGNRTEYKSISNAIEFALKKSNIRKKILFGSDNVFFSQKNALEKYVKMDNCKDLIEENFFNLLKAGAIND